jgi:hypothetical protein
MTSVGYVSPCVSGSAKFTLSPSATAFFFSAAGTAIPKSVDCRATGFFSFGLAFVAGPRNSQPYERLRHTFRTGVFLRSIHFLKERLALVQTLLWAPSEWVPSRVSFRLLGERVVFCKQCSQCQYDNMTVEAVNSFQVIATLPRISSL